MKKNLIILPILCLSITLFSCKKDSDSENPTQIDNNNSVAGVALSNDSTEYIFQKKSSKRGIGFNRISAQMAENVGNTISWAYNWGVTCDDDVAQAFDKGGVEFIPMAWNSTANYEKVKEFIKNHPNTKHILGYNEPNLTDQCNETPTQTAKTWNNFIDFAKENNLSTVSPAMNYGTLPGYSDPWKWLDEFYSFDNINADDISATAIHCYMSEADAQINYAEKFEKYSKPIWVTEFAAWENNQPSTPEGQQIFLTKMVNSFEQNPNIERYAWFMYDYSKSPQTYPFIGLYYTFNQIITDLGLIYFNMSSFDTDLVYPQGKWFPAEHYRACSNNTEVAVSTDPCGGNLMISGFNKGKSVEYKVNLVEGDNFLNIRYSANRESEIVVEVDGNQTFTSILASDGNNWLNGKIKISSSKSGNAVIKLSVNSGRLNINRLAISNK